MPEVSTTSGSSQHFSIKLTLPSSHGEVFSDSCFIWQPFLYPSASCLLKNSHYFLWQSWWTAYDYRAEWVLSLEQTLLKHHSSEYGLMKRISRRGEAEQNNPNKGSWIACNNLAYLGLLVTRFAFLLGRDIIWRAGKAPSDRGRADGEAGGNSCCIAMAWKQKVKEQTAEDSAVYNPNTVEEVWEFTEMPLWLQLKFHTKRLPCWPTCCLWL